MKLNEYREFVSEVTSQESKNLTHLERKLQELDHKCNISTLLTASIGLSSEGGEFSEIVKKCVFQGKNLDDDTIFHLKRELGDILWYWVNACSALDLDPQDVLEENVRKLEKRYPGGAFDAWFSENRKQGDL
ncbi:nucleoside triphosphate pyrophosphohydrolase family protein [Porticoccaceae bacterium]|jgi:NTP pyrophosphatase (non-canonical NTP hydrolase)|nr:nucleoside triphosphate pyrophosphohydrolase family protein [Porticoccaceae bacterium]